MRRLMGGLLGLLAMLCLGLAYAQMARAEEPKCDSALAKKLTDLALSDKTSILKLQLDLTTAKLALATLVNTDKTAETYVKSQTDVLEKMDKDTQIRKDLVDLYRENGVGGDEKTIQARVQENVAKLRKGNYGKFETRFRNKDLSAFVLANVEVHEASPDKDKPSYYQVEDAAILWYQSEISEGVAENPKSPRGSKIANLQEVSSQVAILTGLTGSAQAKSVPELRDQVIRTEKLINQEFDRVVTLYRDELKASCKEGDLCEDCTVNAYNKRAALNATIGAVVAKLQADQTVKDAAVERAVKKAIAQMKDGEISVHLQPVMDLKKLKLDRDKLVAEVARTTQESVAAVRSILDDYEKRGLDLSNQPGRFGDSLKKAIANQTADASKTPSPPPTVSPPAPTENHLSVWSAGRAGASTVSPPVVVTKESNSVASSDTLVHSLVSPQSLKLRMAIVTDSGTTSAADLKNPIPRDAYQGLQVTTADEALKAVDHALDPKVRLMTPGERKKSYPLGTVMIGDCSVSIFLEKRDQGMGAEYVNHLRAKNTAQPKLPVKDFYFNPSDPTPEAQSGIAVAEVVREYDEIIEQCQKPEKSK